MTILKCPKLEQFNSVLVSGEALYGIIYKSPDSFDKFQSILKNFSSVKTGIALFEETEGKNIAKSFGVKSLPIMIEYNKDAQTLELVLSGTIDADKIREILNDKLDSEV